MFLAYTQACIYTYIQVYTVYKSIYLYIQVYTKIIILIQGARIPDVWILATPKLEIGRNRSSDLRYRSPTSILETSILNHDTPSIS